MEGRLGMRELPCIYSAIILTQIQSWLTREIVQLYTKQIHQSSHVPKVEFNSRSDESMPPSSPSRQVARSKAEDQHQVNNS